MPIYSSISVQHGRAPWRNERPMQRKRFGKLRRLFWASSAVVLQEWGFDLAGSSTFRSPHFATQEVHFPVHDRT